MDVLVCGVLCVWVGGLLVGLVFLGVFYVLFLSLGGVQRFREKSRLIRVII